MNYNLEFIRNSHTSKKNITIPMRKRNELAIARSWNISKVALT